MYTHAAKSASWHADPNNVGSSYSYRMQASEFIQLSSAMLFSNIGLNNADNHNIQHPASLPMQPLRMSLMHARRIRYSFFDI